MIRIVAVVFSLCLFAGALSAADGKVMHCFAFTAIESATPADWDAFYKASDALPGKVPGLVHMWVGKLRRPLRAGDAMRQYGACMEFKDEAALKAYADSAGRKEWFAVYEKVRVEGTTTYDIVEH
jgi:antibiotic biosynthesis monooxygenase (ABM) superfamily enzyme